MSPGFRAVRKCQSHMECYEKSHHLRNQMYFTCTFWLQNFSSEVHCLLLCKEMFLMSCPHTVNLPFGFFEWVTKETIIKNLLVNKEKSKAEPEPLSKRKITRGSMWRTNIPVTPQAGAYTQSCNPPFKQMVRVHFSNSNPWLMWQGIQVISNYKPITPLPTLPPAFPTPIL